MLLWQNRIPPGTSNPRRGQPGVSRSDSNYGKMGETAPKPPTVGRREVHGEAGGSPCGEFKTALIRQGRKRRARRSRDFGRGRMTNSIVVFYDPSLPFPGARPPESVRSRWQETYRVVDGNGLAKALQERPSAVVTTHGGYFPSPAWSDFRSYLGDGGGLVTLGGAPFLSPMIPHEDEGWDPSGNTPQFLQELGIHEVLRADTGAKPLRWEVNRDYEVLSSPAEAEAFGTDHVSHYVIHGSESPDHPDESGSAGPIDVECRPLVRGLDDAGSFRGAPLVLFDHLRGRFAGGRWIFASGPVGEGFWAGAGLDALDRLAAFAAEGVTELWVAFDFATYFPGETPRLSVGGEALGSRGHHTPSSWTVDLSLTRVEGASVWSHRGSITVGPIRASNSLSVPLPVEPGLYHLKARFSAPDHAARTLHQGFWGHDPDLLRSQPRLRAGRDYFYKGGRPFPVVGTTYMAEDTARKFLFLPNPYVFDRDMGEIAGHGLNFIRTGLWTAWRQVMFVDGRPSEAVLRALDAFLLTANRHRLEVTFTFFAFTPETWEGGNPYLDPRARAAQRRFISAIVERHRHTTNVEWDLINEPSLFDPRRIFQGPRGNGDPLERNAFQDWLAARHGSVAALRQRWRATPTRIPDFAAVVPPEPRDIPFDIQDVTANKRGEAWLDFGLFSMAVFSDWARDMVGVIRHLAPDALVTAGQDEALAGQRPSPFFYGAAVDYTTVHSWWLMDQLVWDGIFTKTPTKPNLVQETGIMYLETPSGRAKRTEGELAHLLEQKFAYAFAAGGAGAVQWIWNTNPYMHNLNESNIGALRADGSEKPEAQVLADFAHFIETVRDWFADRPEEPVVVVFPSSNDLSHRRFAVQATSRLTRALAYEIGQPFSAVGEYQLGDLGTPPSLVIVPSAHNVSQTARQRLLAMVREQPVTMLWTGPSTLDEYWASVPGAFPLEDGQTNLFREEVIALGDRRCRFTFDYSMRAAALKGYVREPGPAAIRVVPWGQGKIVWSPLPVELASAGPLAEVYRLALREAGVEAPPRPSVEPAGIPVYARSLSFPNAGCIQVLVSEASEPVTVTLPDDGSGAGRLRVTVPPGRAVLVALDRAGRVMASYGHAPERLRSR